MNQFSSEANVLKFPGAIWKQRYESNLQLASKEQNPSEQFKLLSQNFEMLNNIYLASHNQDARILAQKLAVFIKENFPQYYSESKFRTDCLDSGCVSIVYPEAAEELRLMVSETSSLDKDVRDDILR